MSKIIIHNQLENDENDEAAMRLVSKVMQMGQISNFDTQYCYLTIYKTNIGDVAVSCRANKTGTSTFHVYVYGQFEKQ